MSKRIYRGIIGVLMAFSLLFFTACEKELSTEIAKVKPPVRTYVVTARADKRGTNTTSEGTAVLKGIYDEETKQLSYSIEYSNIDPRTISLRSGAKGTAGTFVKDLYNSANGNQVVVKGAFLLTPLQERNMLKGLWSISVNTAVRSPEISGYLTFKQQ
ncbi:MAG: CHRD domain-containing protein [Pedobacter sp.]|nr:MAG: CHRD domain-containing protein [Pedobacter sp.]